jgi:hypothetical protein
MACLVNKFAFRLDVIDLAKAGMIWGDQVAQSFLAAILA